MAIALAAGAFVVGGLVGFVAACICQAAAEEPHGIPRGEDPFKRNTTATPPRSRAGMTVDMVDPFLLKRWDSD
jgi:hypothetical protein